MFRTLVTVKGRRLYIIIDFRASRNFILIVVVARFRITTKSKEYRYELIAIDSLALFRVIDKTLLIELVI